MSAAPRQWGGGEPDTADSGNEICVVICACSGQGPWALANLTEELRSREGPGSRGVVGAETQAGVEGAPAGACVWIPWGVCICAFWFSPSVCVCFPALCGCPLKGCGVSAWLLAHVLRFLECVCVCVCVHNHTIPAVWCVHALSYPTPSAACRSKHSLRNRAGMGGQGTRRVVLGELGPGGGPGLAGSKGAISGEATRVLAD